MEVLSLSSAAILVEGDLEQLFIQRASPGTKVIKIICNGRNVYLSAIAKRIASQCRLINGRNHPILVIFDREERSESPEELISELLSLLRGEGVEDEIIVGVPDRMIENWILADPERLAQDDECCGEVPISVEGTNGKTMIKRCFKSYNETTTGVKLLLKARVNTMKSNSDSFCKFVDRLPSNGCWWLER